MGSFSTIICSVNLTENSEDIVRYTRELAEPNKARIIVAHALPSTSYLKSYTSANAMVEDLMDAAKANTQKFLTEFVQTHFGNLNAESRILAGNPSRQLLELADEICADLIVMGSMSTKGMFSFLFNDYSGGVIGKTRVPVIIIPNDLNLECTPPEGF